MTREKFEVAKKSYLEELERKAAALRSELEAKGYKVAYHKVHLDRSVYQFEVTL
jgi:hypothetical protein